MYYILVYEYISVMYLVFRIQMYLVPNSDHARGIMSDIHNYKSSLALKQYSLRYVVCIQLIVICILCTQTFF